MGCCGEIIKRAAGTGRDIVQGYTNKVLGKKLPETDKRIEVCSSCEQLLLLGSNKKKVCNICLCDIEAAARAPHKRCILGKWPQQWRYNQ